MSCELSIIIINYNTFRLTSACIESIIRYTKHIDYEIILVDNASIECSPDLFKEKFPQIHLIKSLENLGFAKGNNLGLQQAQGDYILLLNSDTQLLENSLEKCLQKIKADKKIGVLSCQLIYPNGKIQHIANKFPSLKIEIIELLRLQKLVNEKQKADWLLGFFFDHQSEKEVDWLWGTFFLTKKELIQKLPEAKLPDDFFMYFEDVQWCRFIKKMGYKIVYFPATKVIHYGSGSSTLENQPEKDWDKLQKITQNESLFLLQAKGKIYTCCLYFLRAVKFLSLRKKPFRRIAFFYFKLIFNGLKIN